MSSLKISDRMTIKNFTVNSISGNSSLRQLIKLLKRLKRSPTIKPAIFAAVILVGYLVLRSRLQHQPSVNTPDESNPENIGQSAPRRDKPEKDNHSKIKHRRSENAPNFLPL